MHALGARASYTVALRINLGRHMMHRDPDVRLRSQFVGTSIFDSSLPLVVKMQDVCMKRFSAPLQQFDNDVPLSKRAELLAVQLNELITWFYDGSLKVGVEDFQDQLIQRIDAAGLMDHDVWTDPLHVGVVPSNRKLSALKTFY